MRLSRLDQTAAAVAFLGAEIDALVFASAPESLMVQMLLQTPGVRLLDFAQNEAYSRRLPFLTPVTLPRGVVDLAADIPVNGSSMKSIVQFDWPKINPLMTEITDRWNREMK